MKVAQAMGPSWRVDAWRCRAIVSVVVLLASLAPAQSGHAAAIVGRSATRTAQIATRVGRTDAQRTLTLSVALTPSHPADRDRFLADLYDPASPSYRHYLTPHAFADRFFAAADHTAVVSALTRRGFTVDDPGTGSLLRATAHARTIEATFQVTLSDYRDADGHVVAAADVEPVLPDALAGRVRDVVGLDNAATGRRKGVWAPRSPEATDAGRAAPSGCTGAANQAGGAMGPFTPNELATAYGLDPLTAAGNHGETETAALFETDNYYDTDITAWKNCFGITAAVSRILVDQTTAPPPSASPGEITADIETLIAMAPRLKRLLVYESPYSNQAFIDQFQQMASDDLAPVISTSVGDCEGRSRMSFLMSLNTVFQQLAAQGQTLAVAAGDTGSEECYYYDTTKTELDVDGIADNPYTLGVGGTSLTIDTTTNAYVSETVWNTHNVTVVGAGSGGLSRIFTRPGYQTGPGTDTPWSNGMRQLPDIAATANLHSYIAYVNGAWGAGGGTSLAAPLVAGGLSVLNQGLAAHGLPRIGWANPALYALFRATDGTAVPVFHDVTVGNNCYVPATCAGPPLLYPATPGYDLATGLGSPDIGRIFTDLSTPAVRSITPSDGPASGGSRATLSGFFFVPVTAVTIGGVAAPFTAVDAATLAVTMPAGTPGTADVVVQFAGGTTITLPNAYGYVSPIPSRASGGGGGNPGPLPFPRPTVAPQGNPAPLPVSRP